MKNKPKAKSVKNPEPEEDSVLFELFKYSTLAVTALILAGVLLFFAVWCFYIVIFSIFLWAGYLHPILTSTL